MDGDADRNPAAMAAGSAGLPRAPVLAYLANISTPTRARKVAALGTLAVGLGNLVAGVGFAIWTGWQVYDLAWRWTWRGPPKWADYLRVVRQLGHGDIGSYPPWPWYWITGMEITSRIGLLVILVVPAILLVIFARDVYCGRRVASRVSLAMVLPTMVVMAGVTAWLGGFALVFGLGRVPVRPMLWWLLAVPAGALLVALLKDLCTYLHWIARAPLTEKPPVAFLPGKTPA